MYKTTLRTEKLKDYFDCISGTKNSNYHQKVPPGRQLRGLGNQRIGCSGNVALPGSKLRHFQKN